MLPNVMVLAFRGTKNTENFLTDAETPLVRTATYPGLVHLGFSTAIEEVWEEVRRLLGAACHALPICVTGHSLGGAMATLASVRLTREGYTVRSVYTYGSPRVGDRVFRDAYDLLNYRFVNDNDLVPHLPFRWCYKHVGELKLLNRQGHLDEGKTAWRAKKRQHAAHAKRIQRAHRGPAPAEHSFGELDWLADHHLDRYVAAIMKMLHHHHRLERPAALLVGPPLRLQRATAATPSPHAASAAAGAQGDSTIYADTKLETVPPLHNGRGEIVISDEEFIAAFSRQPTRRSWLPMAPVRRPTRP
jgi:hypothetical protein